MPTTPLGAGGLMGGVARRAAGRRGGCITPYNFPITNMAGKIGPALAMGNTVVVKPAPQDPLGVVELAEVLDEVGFPPGRGQHRHRRQGPSAARRWSPRRTSTWSASPARTGVGISIIEAGGRHA